ncbi:MAG: zinc/iron-chelating domain-containing protein [Desulfobacterales bacterium]|nr:MAG: zinc/iron-chelating domain-containing protein [Desulfobacterales bacterium]
MSSHNPPCGETPADAAPVRSTDEIFVCQECGECCRGFGGTCVSESDIEKLAAFQGISPKEFAECYLAPSGSGNVIRQKEDGYCVFHENRRCGVHPVKPRMCRAWPFINAVIRDPVNWKIMAGSCPGIKADADMDLVLAIVSRMLAAEKGMPPASGNILSD